MNVGRRGLRFRTDRNDHVTREWAVGTAAAACYAREMMLLRRTLSHAGRVRIAMLP
jgi:hypothetical protein